MARVIFLNCVPRTPVQDGVDNSTRLLYQQASLLNETGIEARIFQPEGWPVWLDGAFPPSLQTQEIFIEPDDVVVFPLAALDELRPSLEANWPCKKLFYCHDPHLLLHNHIDRALLEKWGILRVIVPNHWCRRKLVSYLSLEAIEVIPPFVKVMSPESMTKDFRLCVHMEEINRARNASFTFDAGIFANKYPAYNQRLFKARYSLYGMAETKRREMLGRSPLCISYIRLEPTGLLGLEAMAAGALFCGAQYDGCSDYAHPGNGFWFSLENVEALSDAVFRGLSGFEQQSGLYKSQQNEGIETALRYSREIAGRAVSALYEPLLKM